jgi:uncharacterized membrane protein YidH (DUF202 family)
MRIGPIAQRQSACLISSWSLVRFQLGPLWKQGGAVIAIVGMILAGYAVNIFAIAAFAMYDQFKYNCKAKNLLVCCGVVIPFVSFFFAFLFAKSA